jgi:exonuclease III
MFLQETKCAMEEMDRVLSRCWKQGKMICTDATGMIGGLAILWNPALCSWKISSPPRWSISVEYRLIGSNKPGFLTNVYGPASPRDKTTFIHNLEGLATLTTGSRWILGGYFNMICNLDEKRGGIRRLEVESGHFQALIDKLGLIDLETKNGLYTWSNRRSGSQQVACRLDRFLISDSLLMDGTTLEANILDAPGLITGPFNSG